MGRRDSQRGKQKVKLLRSDSMAFAVARRDNKERELQEEEGNSNISSKNTKENLGSYMGIQWEAQCATILVAPMCKISAKLVKPFPIVVNVLTKFEDIIPKWKIVPTKNIISTAFKDRAKREAVTIPLLVLQGGKDKVTDPEISRALCEKASSKDKTIKMYMGMCHGVATEESDENIMCV
ncbi:hypothetical protein VIGAN_08246600 [Vigna angularis var. angularis]|uniref:Serine aminopeptidase S33 domain-containing protein n=1 Tax=Vigna angularis var. angularis TaxID=157739 RepID=A0A0S3SS95_PHAAN|nr:hypothetical protein VIGAN_08246600 [Vigna angularis var. angularis]